MPSKCVGYDHRMNNYPRIVYHLLLEVQTTSLPHMRVTRGHQIDAQSVLAAFLLHNVKLWSHRACKQPINLPCDSLEDSTWHAILRRQRLSLTMLSSPYVCLSILPHYCNYQTKSVNVRTVALSYLPTAIKFSTCGWLWIVVTPASNLWRMSHLGERSSNLQIHTVYWQSMDEQSPALHPRI